MIEREPFRVRIKVRHYELDTLGHVNHAVYHSYGEVARLELVEKAGGLAGGLAAARQAAVLLESHIVFRRELRAGDEVDVSCVTKFGGGKTFRMDSTITKTDGTVAAEITCTLGLMDLERRKLVDDPKAAMERAGVDVAVLCGEA
ncbi:acyl-CoA thioesterase [Amycolatopsis arida]|uniref:acyl-CoA thioesterase n=1 Tax=Amycolatopsis arida TaxID=587909 RepID=UPI000B8136EB|nr:acyl-CoA thioesterase [Amycolatopsis arida]